VGAFYALPSAGNPDHMLITSFRPPMRIFSPTLCSQAVRHPRHRWWPVTSQEHDPTSRSFAVDAYHFGGADRHGHQAEHGRGFAGIDNPLNYLDKTLMLLGDAKGSVGNIVRELSGAHG
jgi:hypothetical protein